MFYIVRLAWEGNHTQLLKVWNFKLYSKTSVISGESYYLHFNKDKFFNDISQVLIEISNRYFNTWIVNIFLLLTIFVENFGENLNLEVHFETETYEQFYWKMSTA